MRPVVVQSTTSKLFIDLYWTCYQGLFLAKLFLQCFCWYIFFLQGKMQPFKSDWSSKVEETVTEHLLLPWKVQPCALPIFINADIVCLAFRCLFKIRHFKLAQGLSLWLAGHVGKEVSRIVTTPGDVLEVLCTQGTLRTNLCVFLVCLFLGLCHQRVRLKGPSEVANLISVITIHIVMAKMWKWDCSFLKIYFGNVWMC